MATNNLLSQLAYKTAENGDGVTVFEPIPLTAVRTSAGLTLTGATNPEIEATETNALALAGQTDDNGLGTITWMVPRDYDEDADVLKLHALASMAGATDASVKIDATVYSKRAGTALTADLDPTISGNIPASASPTDDAAIVTVDISSQSLQAGDALTINMVASGTHTTDLIHIFSLELEYKSTIVPNEYSDR